MFIKINNLTKNFISENKKNTQVFKNLSLNIKKNEFMCIFGHSGSGKTTLLNIISGLLEYEKGEIIISSLKPKIGYVFQEHRLFPWLTVSKNLLIVLSNTKNLSKKQKFNLVYKYLSLVGLKKRFNSYPDQLSGGEKQRVALARSLIIKPNILLMDEPFSHLDELTAENLRKDIINIHKKFPMTVIFVTHNPREAIFMANKIVILSKKALGVSKIIDLKKITTINNHKNNISPQKLIRLLVEKKV